MKKILLITVLSLAGLSCLVATQKEDERFVDDMRTMAGKIENNYYKKAFIKETNCLEELQKFYRQDMRKVSCPCQPLTKKVHKMIANGDVSVSSHPDNLELVNVIKKVECRSSSGDDESLECTVANDIVDFIRLIRLSSMSDEMEFNYENYRSFIRSKG